MPKNTKKIRLEEMEQPVRLLREVMQRERKRLGISQKRVADLMGISDSYYSQLEKGTRHMYWEMWLVWCAALRLSPSYAIDKWERLGGFHAFDKARIKEYHETIDLMVNYGFNIELDNLMVYFKSLIDQEKAARLREEERQRFKTWFKELKPE